MQIFSCSLTVKTTISKEMNNKDFFQICTQNSSDGFPSDINFGRKTGQTNAKTLSSMYLLTKATCQVVKMASSTMSDHNTSFQNYFYQIKVKSLLISVVTILTRVDG